MDRRYVTGQAAGRPTGQNDRQLVKSSAAESHGPTGQNDLRKWLSVECCRLVWRCGRLNRGVVKCGMLQRAAACRGIIAAARHRRKKKQVQNTLIFKPRRGGGGGDRPLRPGRRARRRFTTARHADGGPSACLSGRWSRAWHGWRSGWCRRRDTSGTPRTPPAGPRWRASRTSTTRRRRP